MGLTAYDVSAITTRCSIQARFWRIAGMASAVTPAPMPDVVAATKQERAVKAADPKAAGLDVRWQRLPCLLPRVGGSERLFWELFGTSGSADVFWLDRQVLRAQLSCRCLS